MPIGHRGLHRPVRRHRDLLSRGVLEMEHQLAGAVYAVMDQKGVQCSAGLSWIANMSLRSYSGSRQQSRPRDVFPLHLIELRESHNETTSEQIHCFGADLTAVGLVL